MNLPVGTLLHGGTYKIIRQISSGGFGITYEAEHVMLRKRVAIKEFFVMDFCNRDDETSHVTVGTQGKVALVSKLKKKFVEEAQAIGRLDHPNIVRVSDVLEENGTAYYVMDYIDGLSLGDIVKRQGSIPEASALRYIRQVAEALKYVHAHHRLHLDIKPGNIMVDKNTDKAILIDFGTSKQYDEAGGENTSTLLGKTPGYAPVEQMGNAIIDFTPATDIYALGATLYKILTGETPTDSTLRAGGIDLRPIPDSISDGTKACILKSMQMVISERPQSMDEFLRLLPEKVNFPAGEDNDPTLIDPHVEKESKKGEASVDKKPSAKPQNTQTQSKGKNPKKPLKLFGKRLSRRKLRSFVIWFICIIIVVGLIIFGSFLVNSSRESNVSTGATLQVDTTMTDTAVTEVTQVTDYAFTNSQGLKFTYTGPLVNDEPNGEGTGMYANGTYSGPYSNGLRHGEDGTFKTSDGKNSYKGSFYNDKYNRGTLTLNTGESFEGTFSNGQPYNGTWYNADGTFNSNVKNGK